jgi:aspartate ammonia-lyase
LIGYAATERIVQRALNEDRPLRDVALDEGVAVEIVDSALDLQRLAAGNRTPPMQESASEDQPRKGTPPSTREEARPT